MADVTKIEQLRKRYTSLQESGVMLRTAIAIASTLFAFTAIGQDFSAFKEMPKPQIKWEIDLEYSSGPVSLTPRHVLVGAAMKGTKPLVRRLLCLSRDGQENFGNGSRFSIAANGIMRSSLL